MPAQLVWRQTQQNFGQASLYRCSLVPLDAPGHLQPGNHSFQSPVVGENLCLIYNEEAEVRLEYCLWLHHATSPKISFLLWGTAGPVRAQRHSPLTLLGSPVKNHSSPRATLVLAESSAAKTAVFTLSLCQP